MIKKFLFFLLIVVASSLAVVTFVAYANAAEPRYPYGALQPQPPQQVCWDAHHCAPIPEPNAGNIREGCRGQYCFHDSASPGAYRTRHGTVIPGNMQSPGCGGGPNQYPCPEPVYIPDGGGRSCRIWPATGECLYD